jgi:hypothetical protein
MAKIHRPPAAGRIYSHSLLEFDSHHNWCPSLVMYILGKRGEIPDKEAASPRINRTGYIEASSDQNHQLPNLFEKVCSSSL